MRKVLLAAVFLVLTATYAAACQATVPDQATPPPQKPAQPASEAKTEQKPISLSPLLPMPEKPASPADPAKMAESPTSGGKPAAGVPIVPTYVIGPEDVLRVGVWEDARFSGTVTVRPDGRISIPLLGELMAAGLTPLQLQDGINEAAKKYLTNPHSTVTLEGAHSRKIYFDGEGIAAGPLDYIVPIKFLDAISAKGGFKDFANKKKIEVFRDGKTLMKINYDDIIKGKHPEQNIWLLPNDHVIVK